MKKKTFLFLIIIFVILALGNVTAADTSGPTISLDKPENNTVNYYGEVNFTFTPVDESEIIWCRLLLNESVIKVKGNISNSSKNKIENVIIRNGTWWWRIECMDNQTNIGTSKSRSIIVKNDTKEPIITLDLVESYVNGTGYGRFVYLPIDYESGIDTCELIVDGVVKKIDNNVVNNTANAFSYSNLTRGEHTWGVNCTDKNGNEGSSVEVQIEVKILPRVILVSPKNNTVQESIFVDFSYTPISPIELKWCTLFLNDMANGTSTEIVNNSLNFFRNVKLKNGTWLWYITCTDEEMNRGSSDKWNLSITGTTLISMPLKVKLISPEDGAINTKGVLNFTYNITKTTKISKCELITNNSTRAVVTNVDAEEVGTFANVEISDGRWVWKIRCTDYKGYSYTSASRELIISRIYGEKQKKVLEQPIDLEELNRSYPAQEFESSKKFIVILIFSAVFSAIVNILASGDIRKKIKRRILGEVKKEKISELEEYIDTLLSDGYSEIQIIKQLKRYNWKEKYINNAIAKVKRMRKK